MIRVIIALFFLLTSCAPKQQMVKLPYFSSAWQIQTNEFPTPYSVSTALKVFYNYWVYEFGDEELKLQAALDGLMVEWKEEPRKGTGYNILGMRATGTVKGVAMSPGYIWVWQGQEKKLSSSALVHELIHVAIWASQGHSDPDHEGNKYKGWTPKHSEFMHKINYLLAERGL
jgi:hypothetical protein